MEQNGTPTPAASLFDGADWFDPIEAGLRERTRGFKGAGLVRGAAGQRPILAEGGGRYAPILAVPSA